MRYHKNSFIFVISMADLVGINVYMSNITILKILIWRPLATKPSSFQTCFYDNF